MGAGTYRHRISKSGEKLLIDTGVLFMVSTIACLQGYAIAFLMTTVRHGVKCMRYLPDGYLRGAGVRGNIVEMPDGTLLLPFYGIKNVGELSRAGLMRSEDRGESWYTYSEMGFDPTNTKNYLEPGLFFDAERQTYWIVQDADRLSQAGS